VLHQSPLTLVAVALATIAAMILVWFLVRRPPLDRTTKMTMLLGLGVFPIGAAATTNIEGYKATQKREFCGSCHVMGPHKQDAENPASAGLASRHARNPFFGSENCYVCHADYGMFGTVLTKMGGMRHVWLYYTEFHSMPLEEAKTKVHLVKPFPNSNCMQCHSTKLQGWRGAPEHRASMEDAVAGRVSCASPGCHGYAHPITKPDDGKIPAQLTFPDAGAEGGAR
jgi:nitrate/TMAO reductase-like tetraheme cytochrome c subunit